MLLEQPLLLALEPECRILKLRHTKSKGILHMGSITAHDVVSILNPRTALHTTLLFIIPTVAHV